MIRAFILLIFSVFFVGNFATGKDDFQLKLKKYHLEKNELKKSMLLIDLATESENIHYNKIEALAKDVFEKGNRNNNKQYINTGKFVLAICLINKGKSDLAKKYLMQCKQYFAKSESENIVAMIYNYLGHCDYKASRFKDAIEEYRKAKSLWSRLNNTNDANLSNSFIATCLVQMGHLEKAKKIFNECIESLLPFKKYRTLSSYHSQLGEIYSTQEQRKKAGFHFEKGAEYAYRSNDPATIARAQNYLAISSYFKVDIQSALELFKTSLEFRKKSGDVKLVCESYYNIGTLYYETKEYKLAEEYFQLSIEEAKKHKLYQDEADALLEISNIYKDQKKFDQALIKMEQYISIKEKVYNQFKSESESDGELIELLNQSKVMEDSYSRETQLKSKLETAKNKIKYTVGGSILLIGGIVILLKKRK